MNYSEFEHLRNSEGKRIIGDITVKKDRKRDIFKCVLDIENRLNYAAQLHITFNAQTSALSINVSVANVGPICRLDVNGNEHNGERNHKHALKTEKCPGLNLPETTPRNDLSGKSPEEVFRDFCRHAKIKHDGKFRLDVDEV